MEKFDHGVVAQMEFVSAPQVNDSGERDDALDAEFVGGEAECELASGGVADHR